MHDVFAFVPLASLHCGLGSEDLAHRFPQPLRSVDHTEHALIDAQPSIEQASQKLAADPLIFRGGLHEAQHHLFAFDRDAQRNHHLVIAEGLAVKKESDDVVG